MLLRKLKLPIALLLAAAIIWGCSKSFLDTTPQGVVDEKTLTDLKGLNSLLVGVYALLDSYDPSIIYDQFGASGSNALFGDIGGGIANKGSELTDQGEVYVPFQRHEVPSTAKACNDEWRALYEGIKRANEVLRVLALVETISDEDRKNIEGQAKFLRGWYHFVGRIIFKKFAYIDLEKDNELNLGNTSVIDNTLEIYPNIIDDVKFAWENLPVDQDAVGKVNKWVAGALLGKVYLFSGDFANARTILNDVVDNGQNPSGVKYDLNADYFANFDPATDNSKESVFAYQTTNNDGSQGRNSNWGDMLNTPFNAGGGAGFYTPTFFFTNRFKTDGDGLPVADPENTEVMDPYHQAGYTKYTGNVDPRLDWSLGRNGIPFLDYGIVDDSWVRPDNGVTAPFSSGPFHAKKGVLKNSQSSEYHDKDVWFSAGGASMNINLIRFADVLLMAAEAEVEDGGGSLARALELTNRVRERAVNTPRVKTYIDNADPAAGFTDTDAAPYKVATYPSFADKTAAEKAIRLERLLELGMEGFRFFDLVRWGTAKEELEAFYKYEGDMPYSRHLKTPNRVTTFDPETKSYYPVPQEQIGLSNGTLKP